MLQKTHIDHTYLWAAYGSIFSSFRGSKEAVGRFRQFLCILEFAKHPPCQPLQAAHVGRAGLRRRAGLAASRAAMPGVLLARR
eukprot:6208058-Pleurochrysis_carterae.AAC.1